MITESVKQMLNELSYKTYSNAAAAAQDRENIFYDASEVAAAHNGPSNYPYDRARLHYNDDGKLDFKQYERDQDHAFNQSRQPEKFRDAARKALSKELCGEDNFERFAITYINNNGVDDYILDLFNQWGKGIDYMSNNKREWSGRHKSKKRF